MTIILEPPKEGTAPPPAPVAPLPRVGPRPAEARRSLRPSPPRGVVAAAVLSAAGATAWSAATNSMMLYGDARAHLDVARRVTDGLRTGLAQLGSVWLPLPHLLMVPFAAFWPLWRSGAAGAIVGGACFVYAAVRMFSLVEEATGSRLGAWCAFIVFVANLNILYVQSTALTEPVLLASVVGAVFHLQRWQRSLALRDLLWASVYLFAGTLIRYEGWALLAGAVPFVFLWSRHSGARGAAARANALVVGVVGGYGIGLWLLYNTLIFGSPLYFLQSTYSAQAINGAQAQYGLLGTKHSVVQSALTYGWAVLDVCGPAIVVATLVAGVALLAVRHSGRPRDASILALLFAPVAFEVVSLYAGQTTIRVPQLFPHGMWNDRYALVALPLCAAAVGIAAGRWRGLAPLVAGATVVTTAVMALGTPLLLADGRTGTSSATGGHPEVAAAYLHRHYAGGEVLADDSATSSFIFAADLDLRQFVTDGDHPFFQRALASPATAVAWVVATPGDAVTSDMVRHPQLFTSFRLVVTQGPLKLYERQAPTATSLSAARLPAVRTVISRTT